MPRTPDPLVIDDLRYGRNGADPPMSLPPTACVEALNVDFYQSTCGRKRGGSAALGLTFSSGGPFAGILATLIRHVPSADETAAELWGVDAGAVIGRLAGGATWAAPTMKDAIAGSFYNVQGASFNGKLFLAFDSAVDRLHVWDGSTVRRVGLATPAAPTAADTGSGSYAATLRYYKVAYTVQSAGITIRRSELSSSQTFTPSGSGAAARVTKPAAIDEGETHWELYGSADGAVFYLLATTAVGTTTYDDSTAPASYSGTARPLVGTNIVPGSWKYLVTDGNRLLGAGSWETATTQQSRVWFTPVLATSDVGDDERVPSIAGVQKNYLDLDEKDGGYITGFGGPLMGIIYVFKYRQIWKLVGTGNVSVPYIPVAISKVVGAINQRSIVLTEDEAGQPCLQFLSTRGPYRIGIAGLQAMWRDNEDVWSTMNLAATNPAHAVAYPDKYQVWYFLATGSDAQPSVRMVFDTRLGVSTGRDVRGGWTKHTGNAAAAACSCAFSASVGSSMSRSLVPHIGRASGAAVWKCDTGTDDAGTAFQAYVKTRPIAPAALGQRVEIESVYVAAKVSSGVTLTATLDRDFGLETRSGAATLTASAAGETRVLKKVEDLALAGVGAVQVQLGDAEAVSNAWNVDACQLRVGAQEPR